MMVSKLLITSSRAYYNLLHGLIAEGEQRLIPILLCKFVREHGLSDVLVKETVVHFLCMKDVDAAAKFLQSTKEEGMVKIPTAVLAKLAWNGKALNVYNLVKGVANELPIRDVVDSSILVDGLCREGFINLALDLCRYLTKHGISPNIVTYNSILHGLCRQGCLIQAFRVFDSLERLKLVPTVVTYSILIDALCKEGILSKAEWLLEKMVLNRIMPNVRTFNSLIDGYCKFGHFEKALELQSDLRDKGLSPDQFTVSAIINGFYIKGDVQGALDFYFEITRKGESPDFLGFLYLVRGLLAKGRMEEARGVLKEMLQSKSVCDSINKVDAEVETESIGSFIDDLCDQGSIEEAVTILNEVGLMIFPVSNVSSRKKMVVTDTKHDVSMTSLSQNTVGKHSQLQDFNHFYPVIASFCLQGEVQNANSLVKQMLQRFSALENQSAESNVS